MRLWNRALQSGFTGCVNFGQLICFFVTPQSDVCRLQLELSIGSSRVSVAVDLSAVRVS